MFTSRAEYRLLLREDNADLRLREHGRAVGLVSEEVYLQFDHKRRMIDVELARIRSFRPAMTPSQQETLETFGLKDIQKGITLEQLLKRPEITYCKLSSIDDVSRETPPEVREQVEIQVKYKGYIDRQQEQIDRARKLESTLLPEGLDYFSITGLTTEVREKFSRVQPDTLGQASRIPGVTPAAITVLSIALKAGTWKPVQAAHGVAHD